MIARPLALAYQPFEVVAVDYDRILSAYASDAGLMPQFEIDVDALVAHGGTSLVVKEDLRRAAARVQRRALKRGGYAHNVAHRQSLVGDAMSSLESPFPDPQPFRDLSLTEGQIVVLDAGVTLRPSEDRLDIEACDYPPFLARPTDRRIRLNLAPTESDRLLKDPSWVDGWNPFVRVLARYAALTPGGSSLDVLMLSTRRPRPNDGSAFTQEWESIMRTSFSPLVAMKSLDLDLRVSGDRGTREEFLRGKTSFERDELEVIVRFEDDIFDAGWAFWLGTYYYRAALGALDSDALPLSDLTRPFDDDVWVHAAPILKRLGFARFDVDAMRRVGALKEPAESGGV